MEKIFDPNRQESKEPSRTPSQAYRWNTLSSFLAENRIGFRPIPNIATSRCVTWEKNLSHTIVSARKREWNASFHFCLNTRNSSVRRLFPIKQVSNHRSHWEQKASGGPLVNADSLGRRNPVTDWQRSGWIIVPASDASNVALCSHRGLSFAYFILLFGLNESRFRFSS